MITKEQCDRFDHWYKTNFDIWQPFDMPRVPACRILSLDFGVNFAFGVNIYHRTYSCEFIFFITGIDGRIKGITYV